MAVEDHPVFPKWNAALQVYLEAKEGQRQGVASQEDVDRALQSFSDVAEEIDADRT
jgi:hypothetical protein